MGFPRTAIEYISANRDALKGQKEWALSHVMIPGDEANAEIQVDSSTGTARFEDGHAIRFHGVPFFQDSVFAVVAVIGVSFLAERRARRPKHSAPAPLPSRPT